MIADSSKKCLFVLTNDSLEALNDLIVMGKILYSRGYEKGLSCKRRLAGENDCRDMEEDTEFILKVKMKD